MKYLCGGLVIYWVYKSNSIPLALKPVMYACVAGVVYSIP